jgi:hypothetical protein
VRALEILVLYQLYITNVAVEGIEAAVCLVGRKRGMEGARVARSTAFAAICQLGTSRKDSMTRRANSGK